VFVVWVIFIDSNSLIFLKSLDKDIDELQEKKEFYQKGIKQQKQDLKDLSNDQKLQKYAREKLLMKKEGEDIYIIEEKK
jgi:cell division protein FtsB